MHWHCHGWNITLGKEGEDGRGTHSCTAFALFVVCGGYFAMRVLIRDGGDISFGVLSRHTRVGIFLVFFASLLTTYVLSSFLSLRFSWIPFLVHFCFCGADTWMDYLVGI